MLSSRHWRVEEAGIRCNSSVARSGAACSDYASGRSGWLGAAVRRDAQARHPETRRALRGPAARAPGPYDVPASRSEAPRGNAGEVAAGTFIISIAEWFRLADVREAKKFAESGANGKMILIVWRYDLRVGRLRAC